MPDLPITHAHVLAAAPDADSVTLSFLTPLRLIEQGQTVRRPEFRTILLRLLERLSALARTFSATPLDDDVKYRLVGQAAAVQLAGDHTRWVELESYSTRLGRATPLGGLVGHATYRGDLTPFWPYLIWGQFTHVGKDAVKGNGMYQIAGVSSQ